MWLGYIEVQALAKGGGLRGSCWRPITSDPYEVMFHLKAKVFVKTATSLETQVGQTPWEPPHPKVST